MVHQKERMTCKKLLAYYNSQKVIYPTGTPAGDYIDRLITNLGAIKPEREYTSVKDTVVRIEDSIKTELTSAKEAEREPSLIPLLSQIRALKANIASFALNPEFVEGRGWRRKTITLQNFNSNSSRWP